MLAVTANWLLSDGSLLPARAAPATGWLKAVRRAALRAGCGRDGRYRPVESICLVFAGDTFELLVSDVWTGRDRPWHGGARGRAARAAALAAALRAARPVVRLLWRWLRSGLPVPAADGHGRPRFDREQTVPLSVFMLAGDRDGWLAEAPAVAERLGIATGAAWTDGAVTIRHGHDLDPFCQGASATSDRPPSLAESIAVDLLVPFAGAMRDDPVAWTAVRPALAGLAAASPVELPAGLVALARAGGTGSKVGRRVTAAWRLSVEAWWAAARREVPACEVEFDVVDTLAGWFASGVAGGESPPPAIAVLDGRRTPVRAPGTPLLGHGPAAPLIAGAGASDGPQLVIGERSNGPGWQEPLGSPRAGSGIVAVGRADPGPAVVDAA